MNYSDLAALINLERHIDSVQDSEIKKMLRLDYNIRFYAYVVDHLKDEDHTISPQMENDVILKTYAGLRSTTYKLNSIFLRIIHQCGMESNTETFKVTTPTTDEVVRTIREIVDFMCKDMNKTVRKVMLHTLASTFEDLISIAHSFNSNFKIIYKILNTDEVIDRDDIVSLFKDVIYVFIMDDTNYKHYVLNDNDYSTEDVKMCIKEIANLYISKMENLGYYITSTGFEKCSDSYSIIKERSVKLEPETFFYGIGLDTWDEKLGSIEAFIDDMEKLGPILSPIDILDYISNREQDTTYAWQVGDMIAAIHMKGLEMANRLGFVDAIKIGANILPLEYYDILTEHLTLDLITGYSVHKSLVIPGIGIMLNNWTIACIKGYHFAKIDNFVPVMKGWHDVNNIEWLALVYYKVVYMHTHPAKR